MSVYKKGEAVVAADIHIVLGTMVPKNKLSLDPPSDINSTNNLMSAQQSFDEMVFRLYDLDKEWEVPRCSSLFSWLANVRGNVKPYTDIKDLVEKTWSFLNYLDRQVAEETACGFDRGRSIFEDHWLGDHSRVLYMVSDLVAYDYDRVAEIDDGISDAENPIYVATIGGETYRELFPVEYFNLLNHCVQEGYHFIIFGFDS